MKKVGCDFIDDILTDVGKFICLFGVWGSWKGRGNQYIEFAKVVYCKLPTNGKQLPAFPLEPVQGSDSGLRGGRRECYHSATVAPQMLESLFMKDDFNDRHLNLNLLLCRRNIFPEGELSVLTNHI